MDKAFVGKKGEDLAAEFLKAAGYDILIRNYRCVFGEIDIIAEESACLVFVEVKARASSRYGSPKAAITERKKKQISRTALEFINRKKLSGQRARFDVVAIQFVDGKAQFELVRNAFDVAL